MDICAYDGDRVKYDETSREIEQCLKKPLSTRRSVEYWTRALTALGKVN